MGNQTDLISVVVPVYNVGKYLRRCLKSLIKQTYHDLEIILVDDGSTDQSPRICDCFAKRDKRVKVIHKKNAGVDRARNDGIELSRGGYLLLVDSDDWMPRDGIKALYECAKKENADICFGNYKTVLVSGAHENRFYSDDVADTDDYEKFPKFLKVVFPPWGKLYRTELIKKEHLYFPTDMGINDDTYFVNQYLSHCKRVASVSKSVYYYNHLNIGSITGKYHQDINACYSKAHKLQYGMFAETRLPDVVQLNTVELFYVACSHYVLSVPHEEAVQKIGETFGMFKSLLLRCEGERLSLYRDNKFAQAYLENKDGLFQEDNECFYQFLNASMSRRSRPKQKVRELILPILQFFVFRLQIGFKK